MANNRKKREGALAPLCFNCSSLLCRFLARLLRWPLSRQLAYNVERHYVDIIVSALACFGFLGVFLHTPTISSRFDLAREKRAMLLLSNFLLGHYPTARRSAPSSVSTPIGLSKHFYFVVARNGRSGQDSLNPYRIEQTFLLRSIANSSRKFKVSTPIGLSKHFYCYGVGICCSTHSVSTPIGLSKHFYIVFGLPSLLYF